MAARSCAAWRAARCERSTTTAARYAQYLGDAHLQAARAASPWVVIWDDHEVENNYASIAPEEIADMPTFAERRLVAYQAWWEHMPVRFARPESLGDITIYRTIPWGGLADLIMLDGRKYRTNQACLDVVLSTDPPCPAAALPARTMLGDEQEAWLADQLASTTAIWPVLGQQTLVTDARLPNGAILNHDQWDGYAPARQRLLESAKAADRTIVLTGDIHLAGVGRLPGVGVEFVSTSISSGGLVPVELQGVVGSLGDIQAAELVYRGYTRHIVTAEAWTADYRIVDDVAGRGVPGVDVEVVRRVPRRARRRHRGDRAMTLATDTGPTDVALLDDTIIAANLARTIAAHGSNEALVARHQGIRWTYDEFGDRVDRLASGLMGLGLETGDRVGLWSPNYAEWTLLQYATAAVGVVLVNINPSYRTHELEYALNQSGCRMLFAAPSFKTPSGVSIDYMEMVDQIVGPGRIASRRWSGRCSSGRTTGTRSWPGRAGRARATCVAEGVVVAGRPDQHPVHVGHDRLPEGRHAHPPEHPQQRILRDPTAGLHAGRSAVHPSALLPLLRDGHGQPRLHLAGRHDGDPVGRVRPHPRARHRPGRTLHGAVRRADDVHRRAGHPEFQAYDLSSLRTGVMAGSPCPIEVMKQSSTA